MSEQSSFVDSLDPVSAFLRSEDGRLETLPAGARILDLACGRGRHSVYAADLGLSVLAVDRNQEALGELAQYQPAGEGRIKTRALDLEANEAPRLAVPPFDAILVFRYLHRALMPWIEDQLAPGGLLFYETFTTAQRGLGWGPSRDAFLLEPEELPTLFPGLHVEFYAEGPSADARSAETARLIARKRP